MTEFTLFKYDDLHPTEVQEVRAAAERIRVRMSRTAEDIIAIGQDLLAVKGRLPHGAFLPWIETEFGMTKMSAARFMGVAERFGKSNNMLHLPPTVLYELAAPSTPDAVRDAIEAKADAGESVSVAEVQRLKREAAEATKRAADAEAESERQRLKADSLADGQRDLIERAKVEAKAEAEASAAADLRKARDEAAKAVSELETERRRLTEAAKQAEQAALNKAKAEAEHFAKAALAEIEADMRKAKESEAAARQRVERLSQNAERLAARVKEHDTTLRKMKNADIEAGAIRERMTDVIRTVTMAMGELHDMEHEHGPEVHQSMARAASVCTQFAEALHQLSGPRLVYDNEGAQA